METQTTDSVATATVTVQRSGNGGIVDLTVVFVNGEIVESLDESGENVTLSQNEKLMATCSVSYTHLTLPTKA